MYKNLTSAQRKAALEAAKEQTAQQMEQQSARQREFTASIDKGISDLQHSNTVLDDTLNKMKSTELAGEHSKCGKCEII